MLALGGGVVSDLAGFVAASYIRGVAFYTASTTLLGMVDAAVGGKTGVNLPEGKNLVGAFWQPKAVLLDVSVLATLPEREFRGGAVELFKHGLLADPALLILELLSVEDAKLSALLDRYRSQYFISGEINSTVEDGAAKLEAIEAKYADARIGHLDGVSVDYDDWHFNVRTSNTEPLMRLCLESLVSVQDMERRRDEVLDIIRS